VILIKDDVAVELWNAGEGWSGDYNPDDPTDVNLLRFDVFYKSEAVDDASYCTQIPADTPAADKLQLLDIILNLVYEPLTDGHSIKKLCERISWIGPEWVEDDHS
jgi:hypothetical protein